MYSSKGHYFSYALGHLIIIIINIINFDDMKNYVRMNTNNIYTTKYITIIVEY